VEEIKQAVAEAGFPLHASPLVLNTVFTSFNKAKKGEVIPGTILSIAQQVLDDDDAPKEFRLRFILKPTGVFKTLSLQDYYMKLVLIEHAPNREAAIKSFDYVAPEDSSPNAIIGIPYIDEFAGLSVYCCALADFKTRSILALLKKDYQFAVSAKGLEERLVALLSEEDYGAIDFKKRTIDLFECYGTSSERELTRKIPEINSLRNFEHPDDILVVLRKEGIAPEGVWMKIDSIDEGKVFNATLLNEPYSDYGIHVGDSCRVSLEKNGMGIIAIIDF